MTATTNDLLLEATLEIKLRDEPGPQGWRPVLGTAKVAIKHDADMIGVQSTDRGSYGLTVASTSRPKEAQITVGIMRTTGINLAMALMGAQIGWSQSAGTVAAPGQSTTAILGQGVELGKRYISGLVLTNEAGTTTYAEGTDYTVNPRFGTYCPIVGGAITDGQILKAAFSHAEVSGLRVKGGLRSQWRVSLRLDALNKFDENDAALIIEEAVLTSKSEIDFKSAKPIDVQLAGTINKIDGHELYEFEHAIQAG